jgi:hypothetical protein
MDHIRQGKHGARSTKQAIAIGLSKARRSGVALPPPKEGRTSPQARKQAERDYAKGQRGEVRRKPAARRSRAVSGALQREGRPFQAGSQRSAITAQARNGYPDEETIGDAAQGGLKEEKVKSQKAKVKSQK